MKTFATKYKPNQDFGWHRDTTYFGSTIVTLQQDANTEVEISFTTSTKEDIEGGNGNEFKSQLTKGAMPCAPLCLILPTRLDQLLVKRVWLSLCFGKLGKRMASSDSNPKPLAI